MQDVPLPQLAVMMLRGSMYLGKLLLCHRVSLSFEPLTSSFARVVVVICRVQEACHHHVSTYIMYVGKVGGPHRTSYPFHSFVVKCYVQKACRQRVVNVQIVCVAAWEWNLGHSLFMQ